MTQLFTNNFQSALAVPITAADVSILVTDGSNLNSPVDPDYELLTLKSGVDIEIVKVTSRTGNTITVERAQDGTTALNFPVGTIVFGGITKETLNRFETALTIANQALAQSASALTAGKTFPAVVNDLGITTVTPHVVIAMDSTFSVHRIKAHHATNSTLNIVSAQDTSKAHEIRVIIEPHDSATTKMNITINADPNTIADADIVGDTYAAGDAGILTVRSFESIQGGIGLQDFFTYHWQKLHYPGN